MMRARGAPVLAAMALLVLLLASCSPPTPEPIAPTAGMKTVSMFVKGMH